MALRRLLIPGASIALDPKGENVTIRSSHPPRFLINLLVTIAMVLGVLVVSPSQASASDGTIDFDGAGWGHGVGMSQWGAYGRAKAGQSHDQILKAYYTGSTIETMGAGAPTVGPLFVNVGSDMTSTTLTVLDGPASPHDGMVITRLTGDATQPVATLRTGDTASVVDTTPNPGDPGGCVVALTISGTPTVWEAGTCDLSVELSPGAAAPTQLVRATNCRRANDCTYGYGTQLLAVDNGSSMRTTKDLIGMCTGCPEYQGFDLVVELSVDEYTRGISEVPYSWPMAALKAQAIAARSYAATYILDTNHTKAGCFCDVRNDSSYQVYAGWVGDRQMASQWDAAATGTAGQVIMHPASPDKYQDIVRAYYSSSNGGASEWVKEKWGGDYPFLVSVPDSYSLVSANPYDSWTFTKAGPSVAAKVWGSGTALTLISAEVTQRNVSGSAKTVRFTGRAPDGSYATKDVASATVASWFGLYSWYFDIDDGALITMFSDIEGNTHQASIEYLASIGAAIACHDGPDLFCPNDPMRREDFAAFMVRAMHLPAASKDYFTDDNGLEFEAEINALAEAGITKGCNPPDNNRYCPDGTVTRGQAAAFIVRAWHLTDPGAGDRFRDDDTSVFEGDIDRLAQAGVTKGCNPPANTNYCPNQLLTRAQMSSFLARALQGLPTP